MASPPLHRYGYFLTLHRFHILSGHAERFLYYCFRLIWHRCRGVGIHSWFRHNLRLVRDQKHLDLLDLDSHFPDNGICLAIHPASHGGFPCLETKTGREFIVRQNGNQTANPNLNWSFRRQTSGHRKNRPRIQMRKNQPEIRWSSNAGEKTLPCSDR